jgi:hypothetical protein
MTEIFGHLREPADVSKGTEFTVLEAHGQPLALAAGNAAGDAPGTSSGLEG